MTTKTKWYFCCHVSNMGLKKKKDDDDRRKGYRTAEKGHD